MTANQNTFFKDTYNHLDMYAHPNPEPAKVISRTSECMRRLLEGGLPVSALQYPIDDPERRADLIRYWRYGGYKPTKSQEWARNIMGEYYFGIETAMDHLGIKLTKKQLGALAKIPFSKDTLERYKHSHSLVAVFPISILSIRKKAPLLFDDWHWYDKKQFAKRKGKIGWHLVKRIPVERLQKKTWEEQQKALGKELMVPTSRVVVYATFMHLKMGIGLAGKHGRCADTCPVEFTGNISRTQRISVMCSECGIMINSWADNEALQDVDVYISVKPKS